MYLKHLSFRGDFGKLTEQEEARAERHFQKQKAAPVSAQHLMRGSGDVRAFCIETGYGLTFDKASLVVLSQCKGYNLLLERRQGETWEQSKVQCPQRGIFPRKKPQDTVS